MPDSSEDFRRLLLACGVLRSPDATLTPLTDVKARLQLFLGRTVPYVTGSSPGGMSSYSQMSVGLQSTIVVTFGKPVVIQSDANGTITVLVTRQKA